jgi:HAD superfamily hydrolase (TIGR01509 family)
MTKAVVFDLDGTLLETSALQSLRDSRNWKACARNAGRTSPFDGIRELMDALAGRGLLIGVCTSSVSYYAENLLRHHKLDHHRALVCWHDATPRKPHPNPILETLRRLKVSAGEAVAVGDLAIDHQAHVAAGIRSIGAGWNPSLEVSAGWEKIASAPADVLEMLTPVKPMRP